MVEGYLTTTETAEELGLPLRTVLNRIQAGTLRAQRVGVRGWLVPQSEIERFRGVGKLKRGPRLKRTQTCEVCGATFPTAGRAVYCGSACSQRAYRQRKRDREQTGEQQSGPVADQRLGDSTGQLPAAP